VTDSPLVSAHTAMAAGLDALSAAVGPGASDAELLSALTICEGVTRRIDRLAVGVIADLDRRGVFLERGYRSPTAAVADLLGWDRFEARRRVVAAEQVCGRVGLDGQVLPARMPATAEMFTTGQVGLRHVETIARVLASDAAGRLSPSVWAGAEAELADKATVYAPGELSAYGTRLVEVLDEDGPAPDERPPAQVNELNLARNRDGSGGRISGRFDDAALYDAIATAVDAGSKPLSGEDDRSTPQRQAQALAEICGYVLDHADLPDTGGSRPHLNVLLSWEDLQAQTRAAMLDFGGTLSPEALRMLACDAAVIPIVMNGAGQPLDVGRSKRTIPDGLRRAVATRDRGCAFPGCGRTVSWCEVHHIRPWQDGGPTCLTNCVMLCTAHHRLLHHPGWCVQIRDGLPEFLPPCWIDPDRLPRRKPLAHLINGP